MTLADAQQSKPFYIKHWSSGMYIHPEGGSAHRDTRAVIHAGKGAHTEFYFKAVENEWGLIIHKQSGLILIPYGGKVDAGNDSEVVFHADSGPGAHFSIDPDQKLIRHRSGRYWHPKGGRSRPTNNTAIVLYDNFRDATKFFAVDPTTDEAMGDLFPKPEITASKPVGSWKKVCQQFCDVLLRQELRNAKTNETVESRETKNAISVALEAGVEFPGAGSAKTTVTTSQERTVGSSMSTELSEESSEGKEVKVALDLETMAANDLFAVWQWVATTKLSSGEQLIIKTVQFTCTPGSDPPKYLPGSEADIRACRTKKSP
jgi:hypothetical protein